MRSVHTLVFAAQATRRKSPPFSPANHPPRSTTSEHEAERSTQPRGKTRQTPGSPTHPRVCKVPRGWRATKAAEEGRQTRAKHDDRHKTDEKSEARTQQHGRSESHKTTKHEQPALSSRQSNRPTRASTNPSDARSKQSTANERARPNEARPRGNNKTTSTSSFGSRLFCVGLHHRQVMTTSVVLPQRVHVRLTVRGAAPTIRRLKVPWRP